MSEKEFKNGLISEEALDEIAGGIKMDKESLKGYLKKAGVAVAGVAAIAATLGGTYYGGKKLGLWGGKSIDTTDPASLNELETMASAYTAANEISFQPSAMHGTSPLKNKRS